jgi:hypothetical protein
VVANLNLSTSVTQFLFSQIDTSTASLIRLFGCISAIFDEVRDSFLLNSSSTSVHKFLMPMFVEDTCGSGVCAQMCTVGKGIYLAQ